MYVCGVTVYDHCHIGHARAYVVFDSIRKILEHFGYQVNYVQNFTDIDDKIIKRAQEEKIDFHKVTQKYIDAYFEFSDSLGIKRANVYPRATEQIPEMIVFVQKLLDQGMAYQSSGDVYFNVSGFKDYGKLSKRHLEDLKAGARVEVNVHKKDPLDFVLWKAAKPGEPVWEAPFGAGRPGWHLECSVMSEKFCGLPIDIHGGGRDLIFPHHENEIAQSEACNHVPFAKYWLHNGFVNIKKEKMSKSLGNMVWAKDLIAKYSAQALRLFLLSTHYAHPIDFDETELQNSQVALKTLLKPFSGTRVETSVDGFSELVSKIEASLADDFNTAKAIGGLFEMAALLQKQGSAAQLAQFKTFLNLLGLFQEVVDQQTLEVPTEVQELLNQRQVAKKNKDFKLADELRNRVTTLGFAIEDSPQGPKLKKSTVG
jgi:cysteinyl-tRNA synthetase